MAYDPGVGTLLLFGGSGTSGPLNDAWGWTGLGWGNRSSTYSPAARSGASMAYDPGTGTMLLFGGGETTGPADDTWTWG
jgi:hypothetical protein